MCCEFQGELDYIPPTQTGGEMEFIAPGERIMTTHSHSAAPHLSMPLAIRSV